MHTIIIYKIYKNHIKILTIDMLLCYSIYRNGVDLRVSSLTTAISVQINKDDKEKATEILQKLGVSLSGLINMTIKQVIMRGSIPFDVSIPKEDYEFHKYFTKEELDKTAKELAYIEKHPEEYKSYDNVEDLKKALLSDD